MKYSSLIENYEAHHKNPEPSERRLPSGWWMLPSVICGGAIYGLLMWAIFA